VSAPRPWPRAIVLAAGLIGVTTVAAGERTHIVAGGESAASLAKKYYGEPDLGDPLLRYNNKPGTMIHPGERLTIPFCDVDRARKGDTWSGLAKHHLGRASASPVLAELNGYAAGQPLHVGARIVIPVVLRYALARGDSLSSLADRFYGDTQKAALLQAFSRIGDPNRLAVGTPLEIPLITFLRPEADPAAAPLENAAAPVPPPPLPVDERRFESPLAAAGRSFTDGEYDRAREALEALRERVTSEGGVSDRREWAELLAFVYIALDRDADACAAYQSGSAPAGPMNFDPDLISPRIRAVLSNCPATDSVLGRLDNPGTPPQIPLHADTER